MPAQAEITSAIVLSAGLGLRMRPLTDALPKPLVPLHGRTLLDRVLDGLAHAGIQRAIVNVHYLADAIEAHLVARTDPKIIISDERGGILDTGGGVLKALPLLGGTPFIVHNSDSVWHEGRVNNITLLKEQWQPEAMSGLLLLARRDSSIGYDGKGDFELLADGQLRRRARNAEVPYVYAGAAILAPGLFEGISETQFSLNLIFDKAIAAGRLFGCVLDGLWMHVGTPQALREAEHLLNELEPPAT